MTGSSKKVRASCAAMASTSSVGGTPDYWQGRFGNHDGVDGGRAPGQAPPGDAAAWAWPSAASSGASLSPTKIPPERVKCTPSVQRTLI